MDESINDKINTKAKEKGVIITGEDISKRTPSSRVFNTSSSTLKIFQGISGSQWYTVNGQWRSYQTATTTRDAYERQTGKNLLSRSWFGLVEKALADTFYPDPNVETSSVDGCAGANPTSGWNAARDNVGVFSTDDSANDFADITGGSGGKEIIHRCMFGFDTTSVTPGSTVDSATFDFYVGTVYDGYGEANGYMNIVLPAPASNTAIVPGDFDSFDGLTGTMTEGSDDQKDLSSAFTTSQYNQWTLNATGESWIVFDGINITWLGLAEGHDINDTEPSGGLQDNVSNGLLGAFADTAGTASDPLLTVTYSEPPAAGGTDGVNTQTFFIMSLLNKFLNTAMAKK